MRRTAWVVGTVLVTLALSCASAAAWGLVQVGPHERSLEIRYGAGACERTAVHNVQNRRMVAISISREVFGGDLPCPAILFIKTVKIRLFRPLAGRHVEGGRRLGLTAGGYGPTRNGTSYPVVPRLIGLAPLDAKFLLGGLRLHAVIHVIGRTRGRPRVASQSPAAGVRDPKNTLVHINVLT
jgi:hypothetical protein